VLKVKAFGGLSVHRGGERVLGAAAQPRRMALLAMVARAGQRGVSRDRLQATLWPDADDEQGRNALKQAIYALRRDAQLRDLFLGTHDLRLNPDEVVCDVAEFEDFFRHEDFERAVALYDGPFLDGFRLASVPEFEHWVEEERRALGRALAVGLDRLARSARDNGDAVAAVRWRRRLAALDPLSARFTVDLMRALMDAGDRAGALQQARIYQEIIAQELDLTPDEAVVDLASGIREGTVEPALPRHSAIPTAAADPTASIREAPRESAPPPRQAPDGLSVAVLPFACMSSDAEAGHLADGLTEEVIHVLGLIPDVRVTGRTATAALRGTPVEARDVGARFGVGALLEGSVRRAGNDVRVTARLVSTRDNATLWTERYDRVATNVLAVQDEVGRLVGAGVEAALRLAAGLPGAPSPRERANELHALGLREWTPKGAGLGQGLEHFRQAIAIDPSHARARAALSDAYGQLAFYGFLPATRAAELTDQESSEALRLAPDLAETNAARGSCLVWVQRDVKAGLLLLERAVELDPSLAMAQYRLAYVRLCLSGEVDAGLAISRRAASMTGASGHSRIMDGQHLIAARRYDDAIDALHAAIDVDAPSFLAYHWLSAAYVQKGMGAEAVAAAVAEASISERHPWALASLIIACGLAGQARRADTLLGTLMERGATGYVQPGVLALAHAALGDLEAGMAFLERSVEQRDPSMMMLRTFPMFDSFRGHSRFPPLLRAVGAG